MEVADVPMALQARLGPDATSALLTVFDVARQEWISDVTAAAVERFERRLGDESGRLDRRITEESARLEGRITAESARLDGRITAESARLEVKISEEGARLDRRISEEGAALRKEMRDLGFDLMKWNLAFWVGQVVVTIAIVGVVLQVATR